MPSTLNASFSEGSNWKNFTWVVVLRQKLLFNNVFSSSLLSYSKLFDPTFPSQMAFLSTIKEGGRAIIFIMRTSSMPHKVCYEDSFILADVSSCLLDKVVSIYGNLQLNQKIALNLLNDLEHDSLNCNKVISKYQIIPWMCYWWRKKQR